LYLKQPFFADIGAVPFAAGLSKLKRLHILKLKIEFRLSYYRTIAEKGENVILKAVSELPELESCYFNSCNSQLLLYPPKLASKCYCLSELS